MILGQADGSQVEFLVKVIAEAGIVGGIAITVIRFLMTRLIKQLDDAQEERRTDHRQLLQWFAAFTRTMLTWEKQFMLHDATVSGVNPSSGSDQEERENAVHRKLTALQTDFDAAISRLDAAIKTIEDDARRR